MKRRRKEHSDLPRATVAVSSLLANDSLQIEYVLKHREKIPVEVAVEPVQPVSEVRGTAISTLFLPSIIAEEKGEVLVEENAGERAPVETENQMQGTVGIVTDDMAMEPSQMTKVPLFRDGVGATLALLELSGTPFHTSGLRKSEPVVTLIYRDEEGQELDPKAAYKQLSRRFHGKEMGAGRREKEERRKLAAQRNTSQLAQKAKEMQRALGTTHLVLDAEEKAVEEKPVSLPVKRPTRIFGLKM